MTSTYGMIGRSAVAAILAATMMLPADLVGQAASANDSQYTFKVNSDLVLVSVTVRDKKGNLVRGLQQSDFRVSEDGKEQKIQSFDIEDITNYKQVDPEQAQTTTNLLTCKVAPRAEALRDRRLIVLFLDLSSLDDDASDRIMASAKKFVDQQMTPADLVSVVTFSTSLQIAQDFTNDKKKLSRVLDQITGNESAGFESGTTGTSEGTAEDAGAFVADDTEYNTFNTDMRLHALTTLAQNLSAFDQKKSILYFSNGMTKTGIDNQAQLRAAINAAVRANVSIYSVDARGLQALPPGGAADTASLRGTSAYSGAAVQNDLDSNFASQETLTTISTDTGGKAFLDTNDFTKAYAKVQADSETYYVVGYRSSNPNKDGRFRRIKVTSTRGDVKLEYRSGYFGPRDFQHYTKQDREQQLQDEMQSDLPNTDLPVYLATEYFRNRDGKFYVPVSIVVPGSALPEAKDKDKASLDVLGMVREKDTKFPVGMIRETVKLNADQAAVQSAASTSAAAVPKRKNVQYNTSFALPPGRYHLKFVVRENMNGRIGTFESDLTIPDMRKEKMKISSLLLASQRVPAAKKSLSPIASDGQELIPNVAHVFSSTQPMLLYYEVYDPAKTQTPQKKEAVRVLTSIQFFRGKVKVYETPLVSAEQLNAPERKATAFQFEIPTGQLKPGWYTCQVNVIDDAAGAFAFPRVPVLIRDAQAQP